MPRYSVSYWLSSTHYQILLSLNYDNQTFQQLIRLAINRFREECQIEMSGNVESYAVFAANKKGKQK
jgi:hypothetical protein